MKNINDLTGARKDKIRAALEAGPGQIPIITARGASLPEAWENSMLGLYAYGTDIKTEYDRTDSEGRLIDPPSKDCTMIMIVENPSQDPFIHKAFPGGLETLEEYRQEVIEGVKDHWVRDPMDPEDKRWEYTYHERLFNYRLPGAGNGTDQMREIVKHLARAPHSRRAQAITWQPWKDAGIEDPPCLQSLWFRLVKDPSGAERLNLNVRFRSRDGYDAAFMNCFALVLMQEETARQLADETGREIKTGRYLDISDSYHIYGRRIDDFENRFLSQVCTRKFEERTWTRAFAQEIFNEAKRGIADRIALQDAKYK